MTGPKNWDAARAIVLHRDGYRCRICKEADATEVDHIWPRTAGGPDDLVNLQAACGPCNKSKGAKFDVGGATIQQLIWLHNHNLRRLAEAERASWDSRYWFMRCGPSLMREPRRALADTPDEDDLEPDTIQAATLGLLSRREWIGASYAGLNIDQITETITMVRDNAEADYQLRMAECAAAESVIEEMREQGQTQLGTYFGVSQASQRSVGEIFNMFFAGADGDES